MPNERSVYSFRYGVFDLDGTLVDSMGACGRIFAAQVVPYGVDAKKARDFYYDTTGSPLAEQFMRVMREHGLACDERKAQVLRGGFEYDFSKEKVGFFPGATAMVRELHRRGVMLFVSSASPDFLVKRRLSDGRISRCFRLALGSTKVRKGPDHWPLILKAAAASPRAFFSSGFFCGDGETDMRLGASTGLYPIGVRGTVSDRRLRSAGARRIVRAVSDMLADPP